MLTTIFYYTDEFCKFFLKESKSHIISNESIKPFQSAMQLSEVMTIMIYWHQSRL
jgi:hypothetical protein